jgi:hypothetical protein
MCGARRVPRAYRQDAVRVRTRASETLDGLYIAPIHCRVQLTAASLSDGRESCAESACAPPGRPFSPCCLSGVGCFERGWLAGWLSSGLRSQTDFHHPLAILEDPQLHSGCVVERKSPVITTGDDGTMQSLPL